jgi:hypothetical protein
MASWILVPCLVTLRDEFNALAPGRDKASDGSIGDAAHAQESSDHNPDETGRTPYEDADDINEVHAIDVDDDLRRPGWTMNRALEIIVTRHREDRDDRLQNIIYNRRIWSRSWGWTARAYTGASAHTEHAHFSARYTTAQERDTSPWGLLEDDVTKSEFTAWMTEWARSAAGREAIALAVLNWDPGADPNGRIKAGGVANPGPDAAGNPTVGPNYALNRAIVGSILAEQILARLNSMPGGTPPPVVTPSPADQALDPSPTAGSPTADSPTPDSPTADSPTAGSPTAGFPTAGSPTTGSPTAGSPSAAEIAAALRAALGDRAAEVGRLLTG